MTAPALPLREKDEERRGDDLMRQHGYVVIRFSQARATMQTEGIPDRRYYHAGWGHALWWEAKRERRARVSSAQLAFEILCRQCGEEYIRGPFSRLEAYMRERLPELRRRPPLPLLRPSRPTLTPEP